MTKDFSNKSGSFGSEFSGDLTYGNVRFDPVRSIEGCVLANNPAQFHVRQRGTQHQLANIAVDRQFVKTEIKLGRLRYEMAYESAKRGLRRCVSVREIFQHRYVAG